MSTEVLDPWNTLNNFNLQLGKNIILGPVSDKKTLIRHNLEFFYEQIDNNIL